MGFDINNQVNLEEGLSAYEITDSVLADYQKAGFVLPSCPQVQNPGGNVEQYHGQIPEDLSILTDNQLAQYMSLLSLWLEYVGAQQTLADIAHKKAVRQLEFTEATIRLTYKVDEEGKKRTVQERDDCVKRDRRFIKVNSVADYTEAYLALVTNSYRSAQQNYKVISRRITQRGQEVERGNRNSNVAGGGGSNYQPGTPMFPGRRQ